MWVVITVTVDVIGSFKKIIDFRWTNSLNSIVIYNPQQSKIMGAIYLFAYPF